MILLIYAYLCVPFEPMKCNWQGQAITKDNEHVSESGLIFRITKITIDETINRN
jgi:hypothetical protein